MAIANGTCVNVCDKPKAHFGLPAGTIEVNVTWIKRGFNARQMHRSMYPSISALVVVYTAYCALQIDCPTYITLHLQPFPSNSTRNFKSSPF